MKILYQTQKVERQFSPEYSPKWNYPPTVKIKLRAIHNALTQATSLHDIAQLPSYHLHPLHGDRKTEWSIYVWQHRYRVTIIPCDQNGNKITSGDILAQCKSIKVVLVTEVSNHYE